MTKKNVTNTNKKEKIFYDFGFGPVDPENSDFPTLAKGIGLDPNELANFLIKSRSENQE